MPRNGSSSTTPEQRQRLFTKLTTERKPERRRRLLHAWFTKDRERAMYGLKEKNLAKTYIKFIGSG
ncbi:hypothetical protein EV363DRAFT_1452292 [Boletus edulis]|uniref:Uncharacterized protein n=1 Tax=Boletus edulis BED1 TaxID=1328754 RepID=A0AAD4BK36_BOLED|nr:hypothetical protein EV363DRAFT_1452292 [Boletus edulis]KAF8433246.1 hypothetical protein L210DRAFT_3649900 [Boletus edulis BED1]